jgi:hypothetical protein
MSLLTFRFSSLRLPRGALNITIGSRLAGPRTPGALPWHALFGNWLAACLITSLYGLKISDLGPFRAARAIPFTRLNLKRPLTDGPWN